MSKINWQSSSLAVVTETMFSGGTPNTSEPTFWNGKYNWLSSGETRNNFIFSTEKTITDVGVKKSSTRLASKNDIVMASAGQGKTRGQTSILMIDTYINQSIIAIRTNKKMYYKFLFYFLKSQYDELRVSSDGSSIRGSITTKDLKNFVINYPLYNEQIKIANILSEYDNLIENNNRRIAILEEMAQRLYREWFVHFRFPGHESVKMVESELGLIPDGWSVSTIGELYRTSSGGTPSRKNLSFFEDGIYDWIKTGELNDCYIINTGEKISEEAIKKSSAKKLSTNLVIMAMYGATIGKLGITTKECACNQACCVFLPKTDFYNGNYLYQYLLSNREVFINLGHGAAQQNLSQDVIKEFKILKPCVQDILLFIQYVDSVREGIKTLTIKNTNLRKTRDLLLPPLICGDIDVSDLPIKTEED